MSDTLKDRLSNHSNAFEGLLSLIPAKYYYEDESKGQWNRKKKDKAEARQAKRAKFDPDSAGQSALDEANRRGEEAASTASNTPGSTPQGSISKRGAGSSIDNDETDVAVFDDYGNQISGPTASDVEDSTTEIGQPAVTTPLKAKPRRDSRESSKSHTPSKIETLSKTQTPSKVQKAKAIASPTPKKSKPSQKELNEDTTSEPAAAAEDDNNVKPARKSPAGIEELRAKLAAKINELKAKRKAPGSDVSGAPKNREELLAARQRRKEQRKRKPSDKSEDEPIGPSEIPDRTSSEDAGDAGDSLMYGQIKFDDGSQLDRNLETIDQAKKHRQRNAADQLKVLENRKAKLEQLDGSKRETVQQNATWSRAILQSEGAKIRDDEKLLRKTVKQKQKRKLKSEKEWKARIHAVAQGKAAREAKRNANIEARKEAKGKKVPSKKAPKKGGKPKSKGRAGFEGKH